MNKEVISITKSNITEEEVGELCERLSKLDCGVYLEIDGQRINARSLMGMILMTFKASYETEVTILTDGRDAEKASEEVKGLFLAK